MKVSFDELYIPNYIEVNGILCGVMLRKCYMFLCFDIITKSGFNWLACAQGKETTSKYGSNFLKNKCRAIVLGGRTVSLATVPGPGHST